MALTFKHTVEFSSFGCTPRVRLADSRLGQLILLYSSLSPKSNPGFRPFQSFEHFLEFTSSCRSNSSYSIPVFHRSQIPDSDQMNCFEPFPVSRNCFSQLPLRYSSDSPESNPLSRSSCLFCDFPIPRDFALRQPAPPYQDRGRCQACRLHPGSAHTCSTLFPVVVSQSAQDQGLLGVVGVLEFSAAAWSLPLPRPAPLKAQRTLRALGEGVKPALCDRGHGASRPNATAPTVRLPRRVIT